MKNVLTLILLTTFIFNSPINKSMAAEQTSDLVSKMHSLCKYTYLKVSSTSTPSGEKDNKENQLAENLSFFYWGLEALTAISLGMKLGDFAEPVYQKYVLSKGMDYVVGMRALQIILVADVVRQLACSGSNPKEGALLALNKLMTTDSIAYASTMSDYYKTKKGFQDFLKLPEETQKFYTNEDEGLNMFLELTHLYKDVL